MRFDASHLANPAIAALKAYDPGHDLPALRARFGPVLAELGSNENPSGPSPAALAAVQQAMVYAHRYPDPRCGALRHALAERLAVESDMLCFGNGSHELLILLAQCFAGPDREVVFSEYGFAVFHLAAAAAGAKPVWVPALPGDHADAPCGHDLAAMAAAAGDNTRLLYLANPNNPTGTWFGREALEGLLAAVPQSTLVVVDEAYHEYVDANGPEPALPLLARHPNLVVTRTFSKAYGLAGLRVGYAIAQPAVIAVLERLRESFNVNHLAQVAAVAALADQTHLGAVRDANVRERSRLAGALAARGIRTLPSQTNFLLAEFEDAAAVERRLLDAGVVVRPMVGYGLPRTLRISVGSPAENQRLLAAL